MVTEIDKPVHPIEFPCNRSGVAETEPVDIQGSLIPDARRKPGFAFAGFRVSGEDQKGSLGGSGQNKGRFNPASWAILPSRVQVSRKDRRS